MNLGIYGEVYISTYGSPVLVQSHGPRMDVEGGQGSSKGVRVRRRERTSGRMCLR